MEFSDLLRHIATAFERLGVPYASPEDVILKKMEYFREGESEKHLRDIAGVLRVQGDHLDRAYIANWATRLDLTDVWRSVLSRLTTDSP
jgi:hypothetical protein